MAVRDPLQPPERSSWEAAQPDRSRLRPAEAGSAPEPAAQRTSKRKPQARLRALGDEAVAVADWASLFGDLSRRPSLIPECGAPVEWRVHDRTHLEFAIDYPLAARGVEHTWEAYFFVPESFRLHEGTYDKKDIYDDLWSYVRFAVPHVPFYRLAARDDGSLLARLGAALAGASGKADGSDEAALAMERLRLFACMVRASGLSAMRDAEHRNETGAPFVVTCAAVAGALREVLAEARARDLPDQVRTAARWTDEDVSLVLETFCATLGVGLEAQAPALAEKLAAYAVKEAKHRRDAGYDSVGSAAADERLTEHFEFRRHMLKRFTASVLWLSLEVRQAATWVVHAFYAVAAAAAMAFALAASVSSARDSQSFVRWALPLVVAYAGKDRIKALLQSVFSNYVARRFPDRKWAIKDRERRRRIGAVEERAGFLPFARVPKEVLEHRRMTREHALEEQARPERVLWHTKTLSITGPALGDDFSMLTEIFRLNIRRWLAHTDDPNRKIVFADPEDAQVYQVTTRRVYNINVVYRMRTGDASAPWHRIRVVVSRKGIERIDPVC